MAISIDTLLSPLVKEDVLADLYTLAGMAIGYPLALQNGEPVPAILDVVVGWICDTFWNPLALPALRAVFLDYSTGDWLTLVAWLIYNRPRIQAQSASVSLIVENHAAIFVGTVGLGTVRVKSTVTGKTYTNTTTGNLSAYTSGPFPSLPAPLMPYQVVLVFEADEVGTASNAQPGDISTTPISAPSGVMVQSNASPALGSDQETDPNLVKRARAAVGSLSSSGPRNAYYDVATDPVGAFTRRQLTPPVSWGTAAPAISRIRILDTGNASVLVSLASTSGPTPGTVFLPDTDVFKANVALQMFVVPPGITATVAAAVTQNVSLGTITLTVSAESRVTAAEAIATAQAAFDTFFSTAPIGGFHKISTVQGYLFANSVFGVAEAGEGVVTSDIPGITGTIGDTPVGGNAVLVPIYGVPAFAVNIVSQG